MWHTYRYHPPALIKFWGLNTEWASNNIWGKRDALIGSHGTKNCLSKVTGTLLWKCRADLLHWPHSVCFPQSPTFGSFPVLPRRWPNLAEVAGWENVVTYCKRAWDFRPGIWPCDPGFLLCLCRCSECTSKLPRLLFWLCIPGSTQEEDSV